MAQNCGMFNAKDRKAIEDGVCTALYRKAGAIPVVVTNVPEFCSWWETQNVPFGRTFNPYDNVRIAGGSSGNCDLVNHKNIFYLNHLCVFYKTKTYSSLTVTSYNVIATTYAVVIVL